MSPILVAKSILPKPFDWCEIPKGDVILGARFDDDSGEQEPTLKVKVPRFAISKYPVTNAQFAKFIEAGGYENRKYWTSAGWKNRLAGTRIIEHRPVATGKRWSQPVYWDNPQWNGADYPVVGISWYEALAFCYWLSEVCEAKISLPSETQWQRAAQGDETYVDLHAHGRSYPGDTVGRAFPWGNEWDGSRCNHNVDSLGLGRTTPIQQYEGKGDSPFGVVDMAGNVWEWCLTTWRGTRSMRGTNIVDGEQWRVIRGGSCFCGTYTIESRWTRNERSATVLFLTDYHNSALPTFTPEDLGFRIVYEEGKPPPDTKPRKKTVKVNPDMPTVKLGGSLPDSRVKALLPTPFDWCEIPAGKVGLRAKRTRAKAKDAVILPTFYMAKYPVTNAQFKLFVDAGGYHNAQWWTPEGWQARNENEKWNGEARAFKPTGIPWTEPFHWQDPLFNGADQPIATVSWYEAMAFCTWLSEVSGESVTLPTTAQWQHAAQGDDGRAYPWGSMWDASRCNNNVAGTDTRTRASTPVQQYEGKGDSPFGVVDMAGNTYDWCLTPYEYDPQFSRMMANRSWLSTGIRTFRVDQHSNGKMNFRGFMFGFRIVHLLEG